MEPVTHVLTGACLARTGLNRRAAYATVAMAIAAEFPDIDTLWSLRGPVSGFEHHRGITHTFLGLPLEAAFLLVCFVCLHRWRVARASSRSSLRAGSANLTVAPVRWGVLYALLLLALGSHLLLDYTNNYGIRPFFPFNAKWYAASTVFIFDPLLFLLLVGGLALPRLFGFIADEVGARRPAFRGAGWARAALIAVILFWGLRAYEHAKAVTLAAEQVIEAPAPASPDPSSPDSSSPDSSSPDPSADSAAPPSVPRTYLQAQRTIANPDPLSIFRWYTASDFGPVYTLATANTATGTLLPDRTLTKPDPSAALTAARGSRLGRIYLDWSVMPWVTVAQPDPGGPSAEGSTITFRDLRFMGGSPLLQRGGTVPLTGTVVLNSTAKVVEQAMDGRLEHARVSSP